jgi:hypothetical protein
MKRGCWPLVSTSMLLFGVVAIASQESCSGSGLPAPTCASAASVYRGSGLPAPAARSGTASFELALTGNYVRALVQPEIVAALSGGPDTREDADTKYGADVVAVGLKEERAGGTRVNLVKLKFAVWLKSRDHADPSGTTFTKTLLPGRTYTIRLKIVPYLITPTTTPGEITRRVLLGCGNYDPACGTEGIVLGFELDGLTGGGARSADEPVDCKSSSYDLIDQQIVQKVVEGTAHLNAFALPIHKIVNLVSALVRVKANVTGMDLASDGDLKLAVVVDQGTPFAFDSTSVFSHYPDTDWGFSLDTNLIDAALRRKIIAAAAQSDATVTVTPGPTRFTAVGSAGGKHNLLSVDVTGSKPVPICGNIGISFHVSVEPRICKRGTDAMLVMCNLEKTAPAWADACTSILKFLGDVAQSFQGGFAEAIIRPADVCEDQSTIAFANGADILYATQVDTDGTFYIGGRSQQMDLAAPTRTSAPPACP